MKRPRHWSTWREPSHLMERWEVGFTVRRDGCEVVVGTYMRRWFWGRG